MKIIECWFSENGYAIRSSLVDTNLTITFSGAGRYEAAWLSLGTMLDDLHGVTEAGFPDFELRLFSDSRIIDELNETIDPLIPEQLAHFKKYDKPRFKRISAYKVSAGEILDKLHECIK